MYSLINARPPYIIRVLIFLPCLLFINFPFAHNADFVNYHPNYIYGYFAYEPLFESYSFIVREKIGLNFFEFWLSLTIIEVLLFGLIYRRVLVLILAYPSVVGMSQFFYGTQIRYAIVVLCLIYIFLYLRKTSSKLIFSVAISFFHFGGFILTSLGVLSGRVKDNTLTINNFKSFFYIALGIVIVFGVLSQFESIISFTRFHYYIGSGKYVEPVSLVSFLYVLLTLIILLFSFATSKNHRQVDVKLGIVVLLLSVSTAPIAGLSGRISLFYFALEPIVVSSILLNKGNAFLKLAILTLFIVRNAFYLYTSEFYFY